jgi:hypothetical protein
MRDSFSLELGAVRRRSRKGEGRNKKNGYRGFDDARVSWLASERKEEESRKM